MIRRPPLTPLRMATTCSARTPTQPKTRKRLEHAAEAERREADDARHHDVAEQQDQLGDHQHDARASRATALRDPASRRAAAPARAARDRRARSSRRDSGGSGVRHRAGECTIFLRICKSSRLACSTALKVVSDPDLQPRHREPRVHQGPEDRRRPRRVHDRADDAGVSGEGSAARSGARRGDAVAGRQRGRRADERARPRSGRLGRHAAVGARRQERHRRRRRQGRRRQDDRRRQPRARAGEVRQQGRHHRRRHLRPERADHARA